MAGLGVLTAGGGSGIGPDHWGVGALHDVSRASPNLNIGTDRATMIILGGLIEP